MFNFTISMKSFSNHFLISMPHMDDPIFTKSLIYICENNSEGSLGIIINKPIVSKNAADIIEQTGLENIKPSFDIYFGGPVQVDRGFVLHLDHNYSTDTQKVNEFISITASRDIIQSIASEGRPETSIITLGFAGWSAGQIESEIKQNSWLTVPCDESLVFHTPSDDLWKVAASTIGVDVSLLVNEAGNA